MTFKTTEQMKIEFISNAERETEEAVKPLLEEQISKYKQQFGWFSAPDTWLWNNLNIRTEVAIACAKAIDSRQDDT